MNRRYRIESKINTFIRIICICNRISISIIQNNRIISLNSRNFNTNTRNCTYWKLIKRDAVKASLFIY